MDPDKEISLLGASSGFKQGPLPSPTHLIHIKFGFLLPIHPQHPTAIMKPETRSLFEGTVAPLLELGISMDALQKAKEDEAGWVKFLAGQKPWVREMYEARVGETAAKIARFHAEVAGLVARPGVALALAELEAAVEMEGPVDGEEDGEEELLVVEGKGRLPGILELDPAKAVLDFAGGYDALCGVEAAAPSLRALVCAWLPRLSLGHFGSAATRACCARAAAAAAACSTCPCGSRA